MNSKNFLQGYVTAFEGLTVKNNHSGQSFDKSRRSDSFIPG